MWVIEQSGVGAYDLSGCKTVYVVDCFEVSAYLGKPTDEEIDETDLILLGTYDPCGRAIEVFENLIEHLNGNSQKPFKMPKE